jgi:hypothetical protein
MSSPSVPISLPSSRPVIGSRLNRGRPVVGAEQAADAGDRTFPADAERARARLEALLKRAGEGLERSERAIEQGRRRGHGELGREPGRAGTAEPARRAAERPLQLPCSRLVTSLIGCMRSWHSAPTQPSTPRLIAACNRPLSASAWSKSSGAIRTSSDRLANERAHLVAEFAGEDGQRAGLLDEATIDRFYLAIHLHP